MYPRLGGKWANNIGLFLRLFCLTGPEQFCPAYPSQQTRGHTQSQEKVFVLFSGAMRLYCAVHHQCIFLAFLLCFSPFLSPSLTHFCFDKYHIQGVQEK